MNRDDIKQTLLLYRPGTADAEDPQLAEALALARGDAELARWLETHCARQSALRAKFRQIEPPAGLVEQIVSEHAACRRTMSTRQGIQFALALAALVLFGAVAVFWFPHHAPDNTLAIYQNDMVRKALSPYAMDLMTNNPDPIRAYLAERSAPSDFTLPTPLKRAVLIGCAVTEWQGAKVSLLCFRTGKRADTESDLWLFVVNRDAVQSAPRGTAPELAKVNRLITASWTQGDKLYFLGTEGDTSAIKSYL